MLSFTEIRTAYPTILHEKKEFILREYLQYKILEIIFESQYASKLCFLGGTCLRIVHQNTRFSEDLDFDNLGMSEEEFVLLSHQIQKKLTLEGLEVEIRNVFKGAYHCYVRIPEVLYEAGISPLSAQKILIQIDTVPQNFSYIPEKKNLNKWEVSTEIFSTPKDLLLSQKIYASVERKRPKGRDFFDIIFLLGMGAVPNFEYLQKNCGVDSPEQLQKMMTEKTKNFDFEKLAKDVEPFLFNANDTKKIVKFADFFSFSCN